MIIIITILGILLVAFSCFMLFIYSNLLFIGYNFLEFANFIIRKPCFYFLIIGILMLIFVVERIKKSELLFRRKAKFSRKII